MALLLGAFLGFHRFANATHIRAGEITARRIDNVSLTFEFTFTGFRDTGSVIEFGDGVFDFGDGQTNEGWDYLPSKTYIGNDIEMVEYKIVHVYTAPGSYLISYEEKFRNDGIVNMDNSVATTFYVESMIVIDPFFGLNNTPILTVPPIDFAVVGGEFIHNAGAFDPDGDSLSYKITTPKQARGTVVNNYRELIDPQFYDEIVYSQGNQNQNGSPSLTLDPVSGDLVWNAPGDVLSQIGLNGKKFSEYNVAFVIEEWRYIPSIGTWEPLGYVTRDMQIIVEDSDNERPELEVPDDICVEAGHKVREIIRGVDPNGDAVKLEAFGGPFEVQGNKATYSPDPAIYDGPPSFTNFEWQTECGHIRMRPYEVQFKATDSPQEGPRLVNFETFEITVVGPAPKGLKTTRDVGRSIALEWDSYSCTNAEKMEIWRRVGDFDIELDDCTIGMPPNTGYTLVDKINIFGPGSVQITSYSDDNDGKGLAPGAKYCYRLVATYPLPEGGVSYVSEEVCDTIILDVPAITHVDIQTTSTSNGVIQVNWTPPYQIDQSVNPPAYKYDLFRAEGKSPGKPYTMVASQISDTTFVDAGLNTHDYAYHYYVRLYDGNNILVDSSATASSLRTDLKPLLKSIEVVWSADVPWSNTVQDYPYHYIYRDQVLENDVTEIVLIDSVDVTKSGYFYLDDGRFNDVNLDEEVKYCYYVTAYGSYGNNLLPEPLINKAQIVCAQPNDTIPPCRPPQLTIDNAESCEMILASQPCGRNTYEQSISWDTDLGPDCNDDIVFYNVYFTPTGREEDYRIIGTPNDTRFIHDNLNSIKGCYRVSAIDRSGNESDLTDEICNDNCPVYKLPNVFTPNNDGLNDLFIPISPTGQTVSSFNSADCPRFVLGVIFKVFDRSGNEIYRYDSYENQNGIMINWDGSNKWGQDLPSGVYYYSAEVEFDLLETSDAVKTLKGWVQILK